MANEVEIINALTGEVTFRDLTADELAENALLRAEAEARTIERAAKESKMATDKAALLAKLGITADEAKLLLS